MNIINIHDLYFSYGDKNILNGISVGFKKNKITGILGPNGLSLIHISEPTRP